jgi:hypothetical protein
MRSIALPGLPTYRIPDPGGGAPLAPGYFLGPLRGQVRGIVLHPYKLALMGLAPPANLRRRSGASAQTEFRD